MRILKLFLLITLIFQGCISQFLPENTEFSDYIAVDALITNLNRSYKIEISRSAPLNKKFANIPIKAAHVSITDDLGNRTLLNEKKSGVYMSDSLTFRGEPGRKYILRIEIGQHTYESLPMEMKAVPPIDSLYAEIAYNNNYSPGKIVPGYQIYVDTHDPLNNCRFYRWTITETWEFHIPYSYIANNVCWKTAYSNNIYSDNTSSLIDDRVIKFPLNFITTETDRLKVRYSLLLSQYSLNEDEYNYWDKMKRMTEDVGGLYDVVPASIESNIFCVDSPAEKVLGYFCVSSVSTKRIFIKNRLSTGFKNDYEFCPWDTVSIYQKIPDLNIHTWIIGMTDPYNYILTRNQGCADCTVDGSNKKPDFWNATKNDIEIQNIF